MDAVRLSSVLAQARHTIFLIGLEVALEPIPVAGIFVRTLPGQDVRSHAVKEHTVMTDDHRAARELKQRRLE